MNEEPREVESLKNELGDLQVKLEKLELEFLKTAYSPQNLRPTVDSILTESGVVKLGRFVVIGFLLLGIVVWLGGSIYSGVKIKSLEERFAYENNRIDNLDITITKTIEEKVKEQTAKARQAADKAIVRIEAIENTTIDNINKKGVEFNTTTRQANNDILESKLETIESFKDEVLNVAEGSTNSVNSIKNKATEAHTAIAEQIAKINTTATNANSKITTAMNTAIIEFQRNETEVSASVTKANNSINNEIAKVAGESSNSVASL